MYNILTSKYKNTSESIESFLQQIINVKDKISKDRDEMKNAEIRLLGAMIDIDFATFDYKALSKCINVDGLTLVDYLRTYWLPEYLYITTLKNLQNKSKVGDETPDTMKKNEATHLNHFYDDYEDKPYRDIVEKLINKYFEGYTNGPMIKGTEESTDF